MPRVDQATLRPERVEELVIETLAPTDAGSLRRIADTLHRTTGGWEVLVRHALEDGAEPWEGAEGPMSTLARHGGPVDSGVGRIVSALPGDAADLLHLVAGLQPLSRELTVAVAPPDAAAYDALRELPIILPDARGELRVVPLVAACLQRHGDDEQAAPWLRRASRWYETSGHPGPALRAARRTGDLDRCRELIDRSGDAITAGGWAEEILVSAELLPQPSPRTRLQWGHAALLQGQPRLALRLLEQVRAEAGESGTPVPSDLPWRLGQVYYGMGDYAQALSLCREPAAGHADDEPAADRARRLACASAALRGAGQAGAAEATAVEAVAAARGDVTVPDDAVAISLLSRAILHTGARRHNLLAEALARAEQAGDLFLTQRTLVNLSDVHLVAADYPSALETAQRAVDLVDRTGPVGCFTVALHNTGEALLGLGRLDEAPVPFLRCLDLARRHGASRTPAALGGLAEVDYESGRLDDARAAFEEAADLARDAGDRETLVPTLGRLATILATDPRGPGDLGRAESLANEAVVLAGADQRPAALVARGWVAVAMEDPGSADLAVRAVETAREGQVRRALGEALELEAATTTDPRRVLALLDAAIEAHERAGSVHLADRVRVAAARTAQATREHRVAGRAAARRWRGGSAGLGRLHPGGHATDGHAEIRVLGAFEVVVDGRPVPSTAWRSRQARTLLKFLVARRERPVAREELCEALWPGDDPKRTGHRLSVLLSSLRGALDPERRWPNDHFIVADKQGLRLSSTHVSVDLQGFVADAEEAARLAGLGAEGDARQLLTQILAEHDGEAFEDDPYEPWVAEARDHVRAVRIQSLRSVARLAGRAGEIDEAVTSLVRLLAVDPYDEPAHRLLVSVLIRARRHGEARRAFERWAQANAEVGAVLPDPAQLSEQPSAAAGA